MEIILIFAFSKRSVSNLAGVHPDLVRVVRRAIQITTVDFTVTEGLRTKTMIKIDKLLHFLAGIAIAAFSYPFGIILSATLVILIAVGKEVYDRQSGTGTPEVPDAIVTMLGGALLLLWYTMIPFGTQ